MTVAAAETTREDEARGRDGVVQWRFEELVRAGYSRGGGSKLAADLSVDLHQAVELLKHGCDERTALAILL